MSDTGYGWTVEMQVKAARGGLRIAEVPVSYRRRAGGRSKISSTIKGAWRRRTRSSSRSCGTRRRADVDVVIFARAPLLGRSEDASRRDRRRRARAGAVRGVSRRHLRADAGARRAARAGRRGRRSIIRASRALAKSQRLAVESQGDGDLGARMARAIATHVADRPGRASSARDAPSLPRDASASGAR